MKFPAINFLLPFVLGIVLQTFLDLAFIPLIICFFICFVLSFSLEKLANLFLIFTIFLFGALLLQNAKQPLTKNHIANFLDTNTKLVLQAEVVSCSQDYAKGKKFEILAQKLKLGAKEIEVSGKLLLSLKDFPNKNMIDYGDKIEFEAKLFSPKDKRNPGEFDYKTYLENRKIYGTATLYQTKQLKILSREGGNFWWKDVVYPTRKVIKNIFEDYASKETAGILIGMFLGDKTELSQQIKEDFANSGIVHLLAVSGLNVGFIAFLLFTLLSFFRVKGFAGFVILTFCLVLYCFLTDLTASVLRASLMLFLFLLSKQAERKTDGLNTLALAAILILIFDPLQLYDVGFQLSFGAMSGILALQPIIFTEFTQKFPVLLTETKLGKSLNWIVQLGLASFTASLGTLP
ncbi:ComEC family competence protein, partial [bacterium]|nr:ComEC family competence protein [bacterium]